MTSKFLLFSLYTDFRNLLDLEIVHMHLRMTNPQLFFSYGNCSSCRVCAEPPYIWRLLVPRWRLLGAGTRYLCRVMVGTPRTAAEAARKLQREMLVLGIYRLTLHMENVTIGLCSVSSELFIFHFCTRNHFCSILLII